MFVQAKKKFTFDLFLVLRVNQWKILHCKYSAKWYTNCYFSIFGVCGRLVRNAVHHPSCVHASPPLGQSVNRRRRISYDPNNARLTHEFTTRVTDQPNEEEEKSIWLRLREIVHELALFCTVILTFIFAVFLRVWSRKVAEKFLE